MVTAFKEEISFITYLHTYKYIQMCVCVCVCANMKKRFSEDDFFYSFDQFLCIFLSSIFDFVLFAVIYIQGGMIKLSS